MQSMDGRQYAFDAYAVGVGAACFREMSDEDVEGESAGGDSPGRRRRRAAFLSGLDCLAEEFEEEQARRMEDFYRDHAARETLFAGESEEREGLFRRQHLARIDAFNEAQRARQEAFDWEQMLKKPDPEEEDGISGKEDLDQVGINYTLHFANFLRKLITNQKSMQWINGDTIKIKK